jgi:hypothetical protein
MWEKFLENGRFEDRRNEKNRGETTNRIPGTLAEIQTEEETNQAIQGLWFRASSNIQ